VHVTRSTALPTQPIAATTGQQLPVCTRASSSHTPPLPSIGLMGHTRLRCMLPLVSPPPPTTHIHTRFLQNPGTSPSATPLCSSNLHTAFPLVLDPSRVLLLLLLVRAVGGVSSAAAAGCDQCVIFHSVTQVLQEVYCPNLADSAAAETEHDGGTGSKTGTG
jgi:hypothetical protein